MAPVKRQPSVDGASVFLCLLAAGCGSLTAALLYIAGGAPLLFLLLLTLLVLPPLNEASAGRTRNAALLLFAAALITSLRRLLSAFRPGWLEAMGPPGLAAAALLFAAPAAASLWEKGRGTAGKTSGGKKPGGSLSAGRCAACAGAFLLIGGVRELLSAGTLGGVRLLPSGVPVFPSFAFGAAGILATALLLALLRVRGQGRPVGYRIREGLLFALSAFVLTMAAGVLYAPLTRLFPLPAVWRPFLAAALCGLLALAGGALFQPKPNEPPVAGTARAVFADGTLPVLATLTLLAAERRMEEAAALPFFGGIAAAAAILGAACALVAAAVPRLDTSGNPHLPPSFRPLPVWLAAAGLAMLALSVLPG